MATECMRVYILDENMVSVSSSSLSASLGFLPELDPLAVDAYLFFMNDGSVLQC